MRRLVLLQRGQPTDVELAPRSSRGHPGGRVWGGIMDDSFSVSGSGFAVSGHDEAVGRRGDVDQCCPNALLVLCSLFVCTVSQLEMVTEQGAGLLVCNSLQWASGAQSKSGRGKVGDAGQGKAAEALRGQLPSHVGTGTGTHPKPMAVCTHESSSKASVHIESSFLLL